MLCLDDGSHRCTNVTGWGEDDGDRVGRVTVPGVEGRSVLDVLRAFPLEGQVRYQQT